MAKEISFSNEARTKLVKGVNTLANAVKITLGPRGRNVIIGTELDPFITNDGVTIAKAIDLEDKFEKMGAQLIRQAAEKTEKNAGDGTTTAIILTQAIINEGLKHLIAGVNPMYLKRGLQKGLAIIVESIKQQSEEIKSEKQISQIATISANNDTLIGQLIGDATKLVGIDGVINVEEAWTDKTTVEKIDGMEVKRPILSPYFITNQSRMIAELENALIMIADDKLYQLDSILPAMKIARDSDRPLFIIAEDIEGEALSTLIINSMKGNMRVAAIKAPGFGTRRKDILQDIATFTGAEVISSKYGVNIKSFNETHLGSANKIISGETTVIQEGNGSVDKVNNRIKFLQNKIKDNKTAAYEKEILSQRLATLSIGVAVLKVGASTEIEMKEKRMRIDDALHATKAAIDEGIVAGGGKALLNCIIELEKMKCNTHEEDVAKSILIHTLESPMRQIAINAGESADVVLEKAKQFNKGYNAATNEYVNLKKDGVIDPTKVVRNAIENAVSIAALILTTQVAISPMERISLYGE